MIRKTSPRAALIAVGLAAAVTAGVATTPTADAAGSGARVAAKHSTRVPKARFTAAKSGLKAAFDASGSKDPRSRIASYAWTYGDGSKGAGKTPKHTFAKAGTYRVKLKVTDKRGATNSVSKEVTVSRTAATPTPTSSTTPTPTPTSSTTTKPTPTAATTPAPATGLELGMFRGNAGESPDASYLSTYGENPALTSSYYTTQAPNTSYETARVKRGTDVFLDFDTKSTPGQIGLIAKRDPSTITNWVDRDLKSAETIATAGKSAGATVYVSFVHEWEVKRAQNVLTNASDRDPATYAAAWNVFAERARAIAPDVKLAYWVGGFSTNFSVIDQVMSGFNFRPDVVAWDPYVTQNGSAATTATQLFSSFANHLNSNATYVRWGKPTKALAEFGFSTKLGDAAAAKFYNGVEAGLKTNGISMAIQFDRDSSAYSYKIDGGSYPQAEHAFGATADAING